MLLRFIIRDCLRGLRANPGFTVLATIVFGLGIATVATQFTVLKGTVLKKLPFENSEDIYYLYRVNPKTEWQYEQVPPDDFRYWHENQSTFESICGFYWAGFNIRFDDRAVRMDAAIITPSFFDVLRVQPFLGRSFEERDLLGEPVALISHGVWKEFFGADPNVLGKTVWAHNLVRTIVGVMPPGFAFPYNQKIWVPYEFEPNPERPRPWEVVGRIKRNTSIGIALQEFDAIAKQLQEIYPERNEDFVSVGMEPYLDVYSWGERPRVMWAMQGATLLVLIIACANVSNLMLVRFFRREDDLIVRSALGATRRHIASLIFGEGILLAVSGGILGSVLTIGLVRLIWRYWQAMDPPFWYSFQVDLASLSLTFAVTLTAGLLAGTVPLFRVTRVDMSELLKASARMTSSAYAGRFSRGLVVVQIAFSCALLIGSALMIRSVANIHGAKIPFETDRLINATAVLVEQQDEQERQLQCHRLVDHLMQHPEIEYAAIYQGFWNGLGYYQSLSSRIQIEGTELPHQSDHPTTHFSQITPEYFETLGVELPDGRSFRRSDTIDSLSVAIVNHTFAEKFWSGESSLGKRFRRFRGWHPRDVDSPPWRTVVGVAPDLLMQGLIEPEDDGAGFYIPLAQNIQALTIQIMARGTREDMATFGPELRQMIASFDNNLPLTNVSTWQEGLDRSLLDRRIIVSMFLGFGCLSLFLAMIGIYSVVSFSVSQRTREIGLRIALGASLRSIQALIIGQAGRHIALGIALGIAFALGLSHLLSSFIYNLKSYDPLSFSTIALLLALVALLSTWLPASRAGRIAPADALKE